MGRDATKAAGNPWYQARKKAAEYDDRLDVEKLSDGGGSGYEELSYGNDVTDELCAQIEQMEA